MAGREQRTFETTDDPNEPESTWEKKGEVLPEDSDHNLDYDVSSSGKKHVEEEDGFGSGSGGKNQRVLGRWRTCFIMITNQVGIGILSLPAAMHTLGLIPATIAIIGLGLLVTYTAYVLLQFYRRYPHVLNIVDCGRIVGGPILETIVGIAFVLNLALTCASANVTMSIGLNTISDHAICTVGFIAIPLIVCWLLCMPRTMGFVSHLGIPCTISVTAAVLIVMISIGVSGPGNLSTDSTVEWRLFGDAPFQESLEAILNIAFAYAGNQAFVTLMAEMRDPSQDFVPAMILLQVYTIPVYVVVGAVVYVLVGADVASPALGSAPELPAKIAYGIVLLTLVGTGLVFGHTAIKYMYVFVMRRIIKSKTGLGTQNMQTWAIWLGLGTFFWIVAFILANAVPVFSSILGISSALFVSWFTFGISGVFWLFLNWDVQFSKTVPQADPMQSPAGLKRTWRRFANFWITWQMPMLAVLNWAIVAMTLFLNAAGLWSSIDLFIGIINDPDNPVGGPFTCGNNAAF